MMKYNSYFVKIIKSFSFATQGILYCIKNEINFRVHIVVALLVLIFSRFYSFTKIEYMILILTISLVVTFEIINTSIETIVNLISPEYNKLAKIIKDTAAGAVLLSAVSAVVIGIILFWDKKVLSNIMKYFHNNNSFKIEMLILAIISYLFIFKFFNNKGSK